MTVDVIEVTAQERVTLQNLIQLYLHDLSTITGYDVNSLGLFEDYCTDACWKEGTFPFLIKVAGQLAGFAVVKRTNGASEQATNVMLHFFVLRKYRRRGIGTKAANQLFSKFLGKWGIGYIEDNEPAQLFWESVVR